MKRLMYLTIGYTVFKISSCHAKELLNFANMHGIRLLSFCVDESTAKAKIYNRDERELFQRLKNCCIEYEVIYRRGICHTVKKYCHRAGMIIGIFVFFAVMYISPMFVWEINVSGIDRLNRDYICELIEKEGVYIGAFSPTVDRKALYRNILRTSKDISWISVNFIGSSANVEVVERDYTDTAKTLADGANIIAKKDGKIIEADVICGRLVTKSGSVVKKGDILVSGVYETAKTGTRYVYSNAKVYATVYDEYIIEIPLKCQKKIYGDETVSECFIRMFGKSVNIFKNYSILDGNYDTINKDVTLPLPALDKLPLSFEIVSALPYSYEDVLLTETEALEYARREFYKKLDNEADYIETLSIEETVTVENSVLVLRCSVEAVENIGATAEFEIR